MQKPIYLTQTLLKHCFRSHPASESCFKVCKHFHVKKHKLQSHTNIIILFQVKHYPQQNSFLQLLKQVIFEGAEFHNEITFVGLHFCESKRISVLIETKTIQFKAVIWNFKKMPHFYRQFKCLLVYNETKAHGSHFSL